MPFELGITDNPISSAHSRLVAPYCEQWTELSPSITIQEDENTPYTCNCELLPDHHLGFPSREGETAAYAIMEYTNSEPQAHCPVPGSRGNQMLPGQGKGAGTAEGFLQSKPTEIDIRTHICQKAGNKWPAVCTYLGVPRAQVQMARGNNPHQEEDACFEAVMHWRSGNTTVAVSWAGLLRALRSASLSYIADTIAVENGVKPVKVDFSLPLPCLQHARERTHCRYKLFKLADGKRMQFVKLFVLQNLPKPRLKEERDRIEFLKRYRENGIRISGAENCIVTVDHFLYRASHHTRIIYGQPGVGKTTFLKRLCQKVANNEVSDFYLVLFFPLRDKAVSLALQSNSTPYEAGLESLFQYCIPGRKCSISAKEILENEGEKVLMIFDGADEVHGLMESSAGSLLEALLEGRLLPQAHFIVSTRPGGCPLLQEHSTLFYEILGFDEEAVESYVEDYFKSEPSKGKAMLSDLRARPDLLEGAYIPMNLLILCSIYEHGVEGKAAFPPTMTECYKLSTAKTVTRHKQLKKKNSRIDPSLTDLSPDVEQLLLNLGKLAFSGLFNTPPNYIFQEDEVRHIFHATIRHDETLDDSSFGGLLHLYPSMDGFLSTLNFSHTTNQEYFAAYYLSKLPKDDQARFWRENHLIPKFAVVLKFFVGLTQLKLAEVSQAILFSGDALSSECDMCNPHLLYVFHALFESQNESLTQNTVRHLKPDLCFGMYLSPFDIMAVSYCLTKCNHIQGLDLTQGDSQQLSPASFRHVLSIAQCNPRMTSLYLPMDTFTEEDAKTLCCAVTSLKSLALLIKSSTTPEALALIFSHKTLEDMFTNLPNVRTKNGLKQLENSVSRSHLKRLRLDVYNSLLIPILNGLKTNRSVTELAVSCFEESVEASQAVANCTQYMPQLKTLYTTLTDPLPVLGAMEHRKSPLEEITALISLWFLYPDKHTEVYWKQLKEAAMSAKVLKVDIDVSNEAKQALECGLSMNPLKPKKTLTWLPRAEFWPV